MDYKSSEKLRIYARNYYLKNRDKIRKSEKIKLYQKRYREANKEKNKTYNKEYQKKYRLTEKRIEYVSKYSKSDSNKKAQKRYNTSEKARTLSRERQKFRLKNDIQFKLARALRSRLKSAVKKGCKSGSAVRDLGCSIVELKIHLENKFQEGMSWENHGKWHIDHIKPLTSFDLTDREQLLRACNYTNLQPLWASDNIRKYNK